MDEKVEVANGKIMSEPHYFPRETNGLENGSRPASWAPARLARRLFEESATGGPVPSQRLKSEEAQGMPDHVTIVPRCLALSLQSFHISFNCLCDAAV